MHKTGRLFLQNYQVKMRYLLQNLVLRVRQNLSVVQTLPKYLSWLMWAGLKKITGAHIHSGATGENGDVVATLSKEVTAEDQDNPEIQLTGNVTKDELAGPLEGKEISDLVSIMNNGSAYVNVHTEIYPDGAIRGQIEPETQVTSTESDAMINENTSSLMMEQGNVTEGNITQSNNIS